ncbi:hypothetical protein HC928_18700 [bacterium]|nr:hypothetical protein [bacterium]
MYTSILTGVVAVGQGVYVWRQGGYRHWRGFGFALGLAGVSFLPWMVVMVTRWGLLQDNTEWMQQPMGVVSLLVIWLYSLVILFFDAPVVLSTPGVTIAKFVTALAVLTIIGVCFRWVWRRSSPAIGQFISALALPVPVA